MLSDEDPLVMKPATFLSNEVRNQVAGNSPPNSESSTNNIC